MNRRSATKVVLLTAFTSTPLYAWKPFRKPFGDNGLGITVRTPFGKNNLGVTIRTPLGRNGMGYQPLKKPLGDAGGDIEKWIADNKELLIAAAVTLVAIAIVQPELAAITWADFAIVASADGVAIGVTMSATPSKQRGSPQQQKEQEVPAWPLGIAPEIFSELPKISKTGIEDPRVVSLMAFMEHPTAYNDLKKALENADKMVFPPACDPKLIKIFNDINREAMLPMSKFVYDYAKANNSLVGAENDKRYLALREKVDKHWSKLAELKPTKEQIEACTKAMAAHLKWLNSRPR